MAAATEQAENSTQHSDSSISITGCFAQGNELELPEFPGAHFLFIFYFFIHVRCNSEELHQDCCN